MDIIDMLDRLADYQAQRDLLEIKKRELLDTVKVPAEVLAAQDAANKARQSADIALFKAQSAIRDAERDELSNIVKPELPAEYIAAMEAYQTKVETARALVSSQIEQWQQRTLEAKSKIDSELQAKTAQVYASLEMRKAEISIEFGEKAGAVDANIAKLKAEIIAATIEHGSSVKGAVFHAVYVPGRVTWNTDKLDGMAEIFPQLKAARKVGEPSVTVRPIATKSK